MRDNVHGGKTALLQPSSAQLNETLLVGREAVETKRNNANTAAG